MPTRAKGRQFEAEVEATFPAYRAGGFAHLMRMPVPTVPTGTQTKHGPVMRLSGSAPFDVVGYTLDTGKMIGAELKESARTKTSLRIVGPGLSGSGVQWHQLEALYGLHYAGGHAYLLWSNGGLVGRIAGDELAEAYERAERAFSGRSEKVGQKSIPFKDLTRVAWTEISGSPTLDWLGVDTTNPM